MQHKEIKVGRMYSVYFQEQYSGFGIKNCIPTNSHSWYTENGSYPCFVRLMDNLYPKPTLTISVEFNRFTQCNSISTFPIIYTCRTKYYDGVYLEFFYMPLKLLAFCDFRPRSKRTKAYRTIINIAKKENMKCYNKDLGSISGSGCYCHLGR